MLSGKKVVVIGTGKMGEAVIRGLLDSETLEPNQIVATRLHQDRLGAFCKQYGIEGADSNAVAAARADILICCVKPQDMEATLKEIRQEIKPETLVISVAASVTTEFLERHLDAGAPVIRAMPNMPCLLGVGITALAAGIHADEHHLGVAQSIFGSIGRTVVLPDSQMDAVTGLSASGPAYIYIIIEALAEAGVKVGLPRAVATELVAQTVLGSAQMVLQTGQHPALLKDMVTTPKGCTMDGIMALEDGGIRVTLIKAVVDAVRRASELIHS